MSKVSIFSNFTRFLFQFAVTSNTGNEGPRDLLNSQHGPGSVLVSEIDLSSPLNYGTPSSLGSFRTPGGNRGTPIRLRSDIQSERKLRQVNVTGSQQPGSSQPSGTHFHKEIHNLNSLLQILFLTVRVSNRSYDFENCGRSDVFQTLHLFKTVRT